MFTNCIPVLFRSSSNTNLELINKGLHMDVIESEKLKWMEDVPIIIQPLPNSLYNARFDFEGIFQFFFTHLFVVQNNIVIILL